MVLSEVAEHDDHANVFLYNHFPEVRDRMGQRSLGCDDHFFLGVDELA